MTGMDGNVAYKNKQIDNVEISNEGRRALREKLRKVKPKVEEPIGYELTIQDTNEVEWEHYISMREYSVVLCQDLVQVKMSFSHSNLPAIPKLPVDTIFQNHRVTYNRNDYEFVWYYKTFPSIQIPSGMHVCNC